MTDIEQMPLSELLTIVQACDRVMKNAKILNPTDYGYFSQQKIIHTLDSALNRIALLINEVES